MAWAARYGGTCPACGEHIAKGDQVRWSGDTLDRARAVVHEDCGDPPHVPERPVRVCGRCHL